MRPSICLLLSLAGLGCGASVTQNPTGLADVPDAAVDVAPAAVDVPPAPVDVPVAMVDVPPPEPTDLALGETCTRDQQCASGLCAQTPGVVAGCAQPCVDDETCLAVNSQLSCVLDRAPGGGRLVCGQVVSAEVDPAGACTQDTECFSGFCLDGLCHNPCADDSVCAAGWRCGAQPVGARSVQVCRANPISGVTVEDYVLFEGLASVDRGTLPLQVVAPPDTVSLTWVTQDLAGPDLFASVTGVTAPDGRTLVDLRSWNTLREQQVRTLPSRLQINGATFPGRTMEPMVPGVFRSSHALLNDRSGSPVASRRMRAMVRVKRAPGGIAANGWTLRLRVIMGGIAGLNAAAAPRNARLQSALSRMRAIYASVGVNLAVEGYADLSAADAARFATIDSQEELRALFQRSSGMTGDVLPIFLVRGISSAAGLENAIGIAGGINGPPGIFGTVSSGVVASWDNTFGRTDLLAQVLAHECGHYLGLWHTMERNPACTTAGQADCSLWGGVDNLTDTPATMAGASRYLMYWTTSGSNELVSAGQGLMMRGNPIIH
ncbi:MAG: hypothetical protein EPO40_09120 [Myxococcaceae bacterium]|nr:MAG: hypothetical protein EPO40_09120 [Myxococcaceae bacterium]